jgi:hypothetical protein
MGYGGAASFAQRTLPPSRAISAEGEPLRIRVARRSPTVAGDSLIAHSQTTSTLHCSANSACVDRSSRLLFAISLASQNAVLVAGRRNSAQRSWRCQKHPCTKTTVLHLGRTISGEPGNRFTFNLKRKPACHKLRRICISGAVSRPRIRDITAERLSGVITSVMSSVSQAFTHQYI